MVVYNDNTMNVKCNNTENTISVFKKTYNDYIVEFTNNKIENKTMLQKLKYKFKLILNILKGKEQVITQIELNDEDMRELASSIVLLRSLNDKNYYNLDK